MKAVNIDELGADVPRDELGFPVRGALPAAPPEPGMSLADMTNQYTYVKGKFWSRAPKLKQQKKITALAAQVQGVADPVAIMDMTSQAATYLLFIEEGEEYRPATVDEIDEEFDLTEVQALMQSATGAKAGSEKN